jgi:hypothetical protein
MPRGRCAVFCVYPLSHAISVCVVLLKHCELSTKKRGLSLRDTIVSQTLVLNFKFHFMILTNTMVMSHLKIRSYIKFSGVHATLQFQSFIFIC